MRRIATKLSSFTPIYIMSWHTDVAEGVIFAKTVVDQRIPRTVSYLFPC